MIIKTLAIVSLCLASIQASKVGAPQLPKKHLVCYYDSTSFVKEGLGKLVIDELEPALQFCDYLIYGYAGIERDSHKAVSLNQQLDLDLGKGLYRTVTRLKRKYPNVKILLSVGGDKDIELDKDAKELPNKYLELLESPTGRNRFVNTVYSLVKTYGFDGLDVAWQFPKNKPKKVHSGIGSLWKGFKKVFSGDSIVDEKSEEHKEQFTALLRDVKNAFRPDNLLLSTTVLPNVNSSLFYDIPAVVNYLDFVNLAAFDFFTPQRNPEVADYAAPIYELSERNPEFNVAAQVKYWLRHNCPASKINVGVATYGRPWKLTDDSGDTGVPPVKDVKDEAPVGGNSQVAGIYSWPEVCALLPNQNNAYSKGASAPLTKVQDPAKRFGSYAYRAADKKGDNGIWVSFEDPDTAADKAGYVRTENLGGVALFDLSYDDFRGLCTNEKYPILRAVKYRLTN
ncbi:imaginal disk growth factor 6 [Drosophila santomea]|uniref:imaginal disk growth factor 6 n=1 Tax=Drosophila santomea TaxID=129105 RepID=UPI001954103E|nr:imaginal disk growth factor 6 [Drosophila santomea]